MIFGLTSFIRSLSKGGSSITTTRSANTNHLSTSLSEMGNEGNWKSKYQELSQTYQQLSTSFQELSDDFERTKQSKEKWKAKFLKISKKDIEPQDEA